MRDCSFSVTVLWFDCAVLFNLFCKIMSQKLRTRKLRVFKVTNHLGMDAKMKVFPKEKLRTVILLWFWLDHKGKQSTKRTFDCLAVFEVFIA